MLADVSKKIKYAVMKKASHIILGKKLYEKKGPDLRSSMLILGGLVSQIFRSGMALGLFDTLDEHEGLMLEQLSEKLGIDIYPLKILLNSLEYVEVVMKIGDGYYNNPMATFFALNKNEKLFALKSNMEYFSHIVDPTYSALPHSMKENRPMGLYQMFGDNCQSFYEAISQDSEKNSYFTNFMREFTNLNKEKVVSEDVFGTCTNWLDVGGNTGEVAMAIAGKHHSLKVTVLDFPEVSKQARERFRESGMDDRLDAIEGNALEQIPNGFGGILLFHFIDIFSPEENRTILNHARDALQDGGLIYIHTPITYSERRCINDLMGNYFLNLANGKGAFYEVDEILNWLEEAGFELVSKKFFPFDEVSIVARRRSTPQVSLV